MLLFWLFVFLLFFFLVTARGGFRTVLLFSNATVEHDRGQFVRFFLNQMHVDVETLKDADFAISDVLEVRHRLPSFSVGGGVGHPTPHVVVVDRRLETWMERRTLLFPNDLAMSLM